MVEKMKNKHKMYHHRNKMVCAKGGHMDEETGRYVKSKDEFKMWCYHKKPSPTYVYSEGKKHLLKRKMTYQSVLDLHVQKVCRQ